jgi:deoxyribodipyrimidine photolyase
VSVALHWFRRDLRLADNTALIEAQRRADEVVPVFVLDPHLLRRDDMGAPRLAFLLESLALLARDLEERGSLLAVLEGDPSVRLAELVRATRAELVTANRDHSPYARRREAAVRRAPSCADGRPRSISKGGFWLRALPTEVGVPSRRGGIRARPCARSSP